MKHLPSLKQLEYLVSLADTQHFGKASERCFIVPSTLSAGIRELENVMGVTLAERTKRHVIITPIGKEIASRARLLLRDAEDLMSLARSNQKPMTGDIKLGVIPTIGPFLLPRVLPTLNQQFPELKLYLKEEKTDSLISALRSGDLDAAILALPYDIDGLDSQSLFEDEFQFACHESHPMAKLDVVSIDTLADQPLLLLEEGHCLRDHALGACQHRGQKRDQFEASSLHTLIQMVGVGIGVTLLPQLAIDSNIAQGTQTQLIPLPGREVREIVLVWRQLSHRAAEFGILGQSIKTTIES